MKAPQVPIFATLKPVNLHEKVADRSKLEVIRTRVKKWCGENVEPGVNISLTSGKELAKVIAQTALKDQESGAKVWNSRPLEERRRITLLSQELDSLEKAKTAKVQAVKNRIELRKKEKNEREIPDSDTFFSAKNDSSDVHELSLSSTKDMWD